MRLQLKLPPGGTDRLYEQCELIRYQYLLWRTISSSRYGVGIDERTMRSLDNPPGAGEVCVWYELLDRVGRETNPLWVIQHDYEQSFINHRLLLLRPPIKVQRRTNKGRQTTKVGKGNFSNVLGDPAKVLVYNEAGRLYGRNQMIRMTTTMNAMLTSLPAMAALEGISNNTVLLRCLKAKMDMDPVVEMAWRDLKSVEYTEHLCIMARLAYAACPAIYSGFAETWRNSRQLKPLFGAIDGTKYFESVGVSGFVSAVAAGVQRGAGATGSSEKAV